MKPQNSSTLLARMSKWERKAYREFDERYREKVIVWCIQCGLKKKHALRETPRCLFELSLMIAQGRVEIDDDDEALDIWVRCTTRNLVVEFWRNQEAPVDRFPLPTVILTLTPDAVRRLTSILEGRGRSYRAAARRCGLPIRLLRRQHRRMLHRVNRHSLTA
jgi:hypothetical protein